MPTREAMRSLAEDIINSFDDRTNGIAQLKETVRNNLGDEQNELKELHNTRMADSEKLHEHLGKSEADLAKGEADRKTAVGNELEELHSTRMAASEKLHEHIAKSAADRKADFAGCKAMLVEDVSGIKHDTHSMLRAFDKELKDVRTELAGGHDEWQKLTATMQAKRGGTTAKVHMPKSAKPQKAGSTGSDFATLGEKLLEFLAKHPKGAKMTQLEQKFGLARIQMAKVIKALMDENRVEKRDLFYFAR